MDPMWPVGGCAAHSPQRECLYTARSAPVMIITRSAHGGSACVSPAGPAGPPPPRRARVVVSQSLSETLFHIPLRVFFS